MSEQKTEMEMFIDRAIKLNNYHVLDFYFKSWLPLKALKLKEMTEKKYE
jgi:hypothetical protein